ncbi:Metallo-dependent hydrolase [Gautieria morchelliformis]|nr:Metallo-dependent hydrolase [Gautieria morchelliformis]
MTSSSNTLVCFTNCRLALEDGTLVARDLWIDEERGIILDAQKTFFEDGRRPDTTVDLGGDILSPGFIDIQINGGYGFDFSIFHNEDAAAYEAGVRMVARKIVETGVTSLLPTIITQQRSLYPKLLQFLSPASHPRSATLLGWHAEGPFLQHEKRGAHMPGYLLSAPEGIASFEAVYGAAALCGDVPPGAGGGVRMITAAPEIEGVIPAMRELARRGVVCSIGHSIASSDTARAGILAGARLITHLFNAMPQLHHRDPSIIGLLGAFEAASAPASAGATSQFTPYYGIIVDGCHSHPHSVRLAYTAHPEGCILVTDAIPMLDPHLKDGVHEWRDGKRLVKEGVKVYIEGTNTLAGSVVTLDVCVRNFAAFTGCSLGEAIKCATYNPAACLNIANRKGTLRPGADADLVLLDTAGFVKATWVQGRKVWPGAGAAE